MARIQTRQFGWLEFEPGAVLDFPAGLPGFEDRSRFVLIERPAVAPVVFLQSVDVPELCFLAVPLSVLERSYELAITPEDLRRLGLDERRQPQPGDQILCLALLSVSEDGPLTANLLAPVVINPSTRRGVQAVRMDSRYSHQHPLASPERSCS